MYKKPKSHSSRLKFILFSKQQNPDINSANRKYMKLILLKWKVLSRGMSKNSSQYLKIQTAESGKQLFHCLP